MLAACQHRPTIAYPKAVEAGATEAAFDCPRLDDAILKWTRCAGSCGRTAPDCDLQLYAAAADLVAEEARKAPGTDVAAIRAERMRLLDGLRPPSSGP